MDGFHDIPVGEETLPRQPFFAQEEPFRLLAETGEVKYLASAFQWTTTKEGHQYWSDIDESWWDRKDDPRHMRLETEVWEKVRLMYVEWVVCDRDRT